MANEDPKPGLLDAARSELQPQIDALAKRVAALEERLGDEHGQPEDYAEQPNEPAERCGKCGGRGLIQKAHDDVRWCGACNGTGRKPQPVAAEQDSEVSEELDGTDAAHPAYWRGEQAGCNGTARALLHVIQGGKVGTFGGEAVEQAALAIAELRAERDRLASELDEERKRRERAEFVCQPLERGHDAALTRIRELEAILASYQAGEERLAAMLEDEPEGVAAAGLISRVEGYVGRLRGRAERLEAVVEEARRMASEPHAGYELCQIFQKRLRAALDAAASGDGEPGARG